MTPAAPSLMAAGPTAAPPRRAPSSTDDQAARLRALVEAARPEVDRPRPELRPAPNSAPSSTDSSRDPARDLARDPTREPMRRAACPVVAITSGKGGVGKTSLCVNLAIALADQGLRITVLDADLGLANADVLLGLAATTRLDAAIEWTPGTRARPLESIAIEAPGGFRLIPGASGQARMASLTSAQRCGLLRSIADLDRTSDLILIDTGAGLSAGVTNFLEVADLTMVVATPEPTSITDAYAVIKCVGPLLRSRPQRFATPLFLVANQVKDQAEANAVIGRIDATARRFLAGVLTPKSLGSLGMVRFDAAVPKAVRARTPVQISTPKCMASRDIADLADRLAHTVGVARTQQAPQPRSFLSRLFRASSQD